MIYDMKNKIILYSLLMLVFFACTPKSFKVNVEMANANGKTAYLQKIINNETVNIDSCLIENNMAVFNLKTEKNNDAYHIFIKLPYQGSALPLSYNSNNLKPLLL